MVEIKRKAAGKLIDEVMELVAREVHGPGQPPASWATELQALFEQAGLEIPVPCNGEAHENPHIDHCMVCAPRWGWIQKNTKVK